MTVDQVIARIRRVLMLEPDVPGRVMTEQLSRHDRQALDGLLHQRSLRP